MRLFCFGFGYVASYFAKDLPWESVFGTHRGDIPLSAKAKAELAKATHILHSVPPDKDGDIIFRENYDMNPQWFGYLSTTGVYGDAGGGWVDESTLLFPVTDRAKWRVKAEAEWMTSGLPVNIYRLSGIYGPGRNAIEDLKDGTAKRIYKENQFFSRIHVEDIIQVLKASLNIKGEVYNLADDMPTPATEVVEYAAKLLGTPPPPLVNFEDAELSPMGKSFYSASKKVRNNKIKQGLGIKLAYPTYREGLDRIFTNYKSI